MKSNEGQKRLYWNERKRFNHFEVGLAGKYLEITWSTLPEVVWMAKRLHEKERKRFNHFVKSSGCQA